VAWFAVGCYYFLTKKYELARKYFQKGISLDRSSIHAWIGLGHSFAVQDESDQAMSVYRTVARLFPGCNAAHLYSGMEYLRTNNLKTAALSFDHSRDLNPQDPMVLNELAVIQYKLKNYGQARDTCLQAIELATAASSPLLETLLLNLGHCCRKLKDYPAAIAHFERCVRINPQNGQTFFAIGFSYHLSGQLSKAISYYHRALKFKADHQFMQDMLSRALSDAAELPWEEVYNV
jgi:anaphase-promoting complex subunit 6